MRRVTGRHLHEVDVGQLLEVAARHERTIVDLGTGDGGAVVRIARAQPRALVIGIDADAAAMRERSAAAADVERLGSSWARAAWASGTGEPHGEWRCERPSDQTRTRGHRSTRRRMLPCSAASC